MRKTKTLSKAAQKKILNCNVRREIVLYLKSHQSCADSRQAISHVASALQTTKQRVSGNISSMKRFFHSVGIVVNVPKSQSDLFLI